jgi:hypothetical protein
MAVNELTIDAAKNGVVNHSARPRTPALGTREILQLKDLQVHVGAIDRVGVQTYRAGAHCDQHRDQRSLFGNLAGHGSCLAARVSGVYHCRLVCCVRRGRRRIGPAPATTLLQELTGWKWRHERVTVLGPPHLIHLVLGQDGIYHFMEHVIRDSHRECA